MKSEEKPQLAPLVATVDEAAHMLRSCRASLYEMMARGELPFVVVAGRRRIPMSALRALVGETDAA